MNIAILALTAAATVNFDSDIGRIRPELHSSGFGPQICSCPQESIDAIKSMGFKASRTHDFERIPLRLVGDRPILNKADHNSAAFSVWF